MTIPDLGHCAGSRSAPVEGSVRDGEASGVCPACSGRFALHEDGTVSLHEAAPADAREATRPGDA